MEDKDLKIISSVNIEIKKEDRRYVVSVPAGAPFGEAFDAVFKAMDVISGWHEKAKAQIKESRPTDEKVEVEEEATEIV